jgi:predicted protein tyrosine phosphatase
MFLCGNAQLSQFASAGITHVLSLLSPGDPRPPLGAFPNVRHRLVSFHDMPSDDPIFAQCSSTHVSQILAFGERVHGTPGGRGLVHCEGGFSRSPAAMAILLAQHAPGGEAAAFARLFDMRFWQWPNAHMIEIADDLLKRGGALQRALVAYRRELLRSRPGLRPLVTRFGRDKELPALVHA